MRTLVRASFPVEKGNEAVLNGKIAEVVQQVMGEFKPEAAYFFAENGQRSALFVIDLADSTDIPRIAETFFLKLNAEVTLTPAMNLDDLQKGLGKLGRN